jgi:PAS domain S-box-containing protein
VLNCKQLFSLFMKISLSHSFFKSLISSYIWWGGVLASFSLYFAMNAWLASVAHTEFTHQVNNMHSQIRARLESYTDILRATGALFNASSEVTRKEFQIYVQNLNLDRNFPSVINVNFARYLSREEIKSFEQSVRSDTSIHSTGYPNFSITPNGDRPTYTILTYLEPMNVNPEAFGYDLASHPSVRVALDLARDEGKIISSGRIIHVKGDYQSVAIAMRMALYRSHMPLQTVGQRRAAYYGSVGIGFDFHRLMREAIGQVNNLQHMTVKITDRGLNEGYVRNTGIQNPQIIFDSRTDISNFRRLDGPVRKNDLLTKTFSVPFSSRIWDIEFVADKSLLINRFDRSLPTLILLVSLLTTALLYGFYYFLISSKQRAVELANEMTKDLRRSEAHLTEAQQMANLGSWQLDPFSQTMQWSLETFRIFGHRPTTTLSFDDFLQHVHEEDRQTVKDGLEQAIVSSAEFDYEHRIVRQDGTVRWVQTLCRPVKNDRRKKVRGTIMDITERKITMQALQRSQELLRELTAHQDRIKEEERRRIAREIHDELGQTLLALRIEISMLEARTTQKHPRLNARIRSALQQLDATVKAVRGIINDLRPAVLDLGLVAAIEWQVAEFRRRSDIECELFIDDPDITVDNDSATTLFRILQESLTNIIRHAHASRIAVALYSQEGWLTLKIMDNGIGMSPQAQKKPESFGLVGIEERVLALNGKFSITSMPNSGTTLLVTIPLERDAKPLFTTMRRALVREVDFNPFSMKS